MVKYDAYISLMAELLKVPLHSQLNVESSLYEDWGIDSLQTFELIIITEQFAGLAVPPAEIPAMFSLGDAYAYYQQCWESAHSGEE